jgi:hypothetical protein
MKQDAANGEMSKGRHVATQRFMMLLATTGRCQVGSIPSIAAAFVMLVAAMIPLIMSVAIPPAL